MGVALPPHLHAFGLVVVWCTIIAHRRPGGLTTRCMNEQTAPASSFDADTIRWVPILTPSLRFIFAVDHVVRSHRQTLEDILPGLPL